MNEDLRPHSRWMTIVGTAITVGTAVWGASQWLNNRASNDDVKKLTNDSFLHRLELETIKGDLKSINIRAERIEKGFETLNQKLDANDNRRRR